jgi:hypothetical protein
MNRMDRATEPFAELLRLEQAARLAETRREAGYLVVNETRALAPYAQAALLAGCEPGTLRAEALSSLDDVDRTAPYVNWLEKLARQVDQDPQAAKPHVLLAPALPAALQRDWAELSPPQLLWLPLQGAQRQRWGVLVLARETPWAEHEVALLSHLAGSYGSTLAALAPRPRMHWRAKRVRFGLMAALAAMVAALFMPVRLSVLAPAEVSARNAFAVTAPLDGVVSGVKVQPNQLLTPGMVLADMQATDLQGAQEVTRRALRVAEAELHRVRQTSFLDPRSKAEIAPLQAQVDLKRKELDYAQSRLGQASLKADRRGVAILDDPAAWTGRPVRVGEMILRIADPQQVEVTVQVPVKDAIAMEPGREVRLFLDTDPLNPLPARVAHAAYEPVNTPQGGPAYRVTAALADGTALPRIGLRGTAKIYGQEVTLFYFLFRRPVTALRQWVGW